ncbi:EF-P beta-lysylation protein EpmB [Thiocystis violascens]|uniref:L-lysine 2,3-aminomutase n=1 Tax=Thiocystis violascens (strain ATCC 17096 / DSM 198 / 6111) TaxID=765911 RepID=I3Y5M3_THIV6|nr:EF-P beta-lysylation protein EpmB [Thiocystis violascens]AFL72291.1 L-lysine 2,3-aminomutase [Thiocystis violascens DSM 198]
MVTRSLATCQTKPCQSESWRHSLAASFTDVAALLESLGLREADIPDLDRATPPSFRVLVTREFAALMRPGDPEDPLLRQVLPLALEQARIPGYVMDPVDDTAADRGHGLLQKYAGRALLIATGACAIHCRYCFRRHYPYAGLGSAAARSASALARIAADPSLSEVILSGGDPLMLADDQLERLVAQLDGIGHLRRLRIHTRLPVVLPNRVTERFCAILADSRLDAVVVIHANHPQELGADAEQSLGLLRRAGVTVLNQSVLLRAVNDDSTTLGQLSERLFRCGALPYYLHQLDPVSGAAHFQVSDQRACRLIQTLRQQLPGYLVPRLVREVPGADSKMPI